ncbi:TetR/AcrR family transcriptional regulator [Paenibacillus rhizophilus]|uniref:TetR/AcrR family transcriptional regulator n=1 Tax=Paenibacillus rhizophilus TaxID=1850366 RepID=A0A3N9P9E2_9BACL|nr:TetR/AcrR family transcriptional regulator [Paenibacillus rhizophilus]RQW11937.1 TetR/AcrR family transcriptional regulator [Paenibacillus rhizophilus]
MDRATRKETISALHQENILHAAEQLFAEKGIAATTMDDIAKSAEYSKRTVYLQFPSKEEIHDRIVLKGFLQLKEHLLRSVDGHEGFLLKYRALCTSLMAFYEASPFLFARIVDFQTQPLDSPDLPQVKKDIFSVGEEINAALGEMVWRGIAEGAVMPCTRIKETILIYWSSLSSLIILANRKSSYISETMGTTPKGLLEYGCNLLLRMLVKEEEHGDKTAAGH